MNKIDRERIKMRYSRLDNIGQYLIKRYGNMDNLGEAILKYSKIIRRFEVLECFDFVNFKRFEVTLENGYTYRFSEDGIVLGGSKEL